MRDAEEKKKVCKFWNGVDLLPEACYIAFVLFIERRTWLSESESRGEIFMKGGGE